MHQLRKEGIIGNVYTTYSAVIDLNALAKDDLAIKKVSEVSRRAVVNRPSFMLKSTNGDYYKQAWRRR